MCDGAQGDGAEADRQGAVPSGVGEASTSVPEHLRQVWADLPRRARQRARRRYFRAKIACTNRASSPPADPRVLVLEGAVAELCSAVTALPSGFSARSGTDSASGDAGLQSAPAPTSGSPGDLSEDSQAQELRVVLNATNSVFRFISAPSAPAVSRRRLLRSRRSAPTSAATASSLPVEDARAISPAEKPALAVPVDLRLRSSFLLHRQFRSSLRVRRPRSEDLRRQSSAFC